jgi:hypothetical protein
MSLPPFVARIQIGKRTADIQELGQQCLARTTNVVDGVLINGMRIALSLCQQCDTGFIEVSDCLRQIFAAGGSILV